ncbi:hypothetical protein GQ457_06G032640 [Hibiscus cannabinus]
MLKVYGSLVLPEGLVIVQSYYRNYGGHDVLTPAWRLGFRCIELETDNLEVVHLLDRVMQQWIWEILLRSSQLAVIGAIFSFSGKRPDYLGVQKNTPALALCPATNNCISTSENVADLVHYTPPWNYNGGRARKKPVSREMAMEELLQVIKSTKPDKYKPKIMEKKDDYVLVEYESPILGIVDDVEFWFPPGKMSTVEYRSASRIGNFDFDVNRKRIKVKFLVNLFDTFSIFVHFIIYIQNLSHHINFESEFCHRRLPIKVERFDRKKMAMGNLLGWLVTFFFLISLLAIICYQIICLIDLEIDYINPYDSAVRINKVVMPEFIIQAVFCLVCLITEHYLLCFLSLPYLYYNFSLYRRRRHLIDVTEIFNQLKWEKKQRLIKLGYLTMLLIVFIFW